MSLSLNTPIYEHYVQSDKMMTQPLLVLSIGSRVAIYLSSLFLYWIRWVILRLIACQLVIEYYRSFCKYRLVRSFCDILIK